MKPHLFVATPAYGMQVTQAYTKSLIQLYALLRECGMDMAYPELGNESLVQRARNTLTQWFFESKSTHLLFIDADIRFEATAVLRMLGTGHKIVAAPYPRKEIRFDRIAHEVLRRHEAGDESIFRKRKNPLEQSYGHHVITTTDDERQESVNECIKVVEAGTGFMLIAREVLEAMRDKLHEANLGTIAEPLGKGTGTPVYPIFHTDVGTIPGMSSGEHIWQRRYVSEDYLFCERARALGYDTWLYLGTKLGHIGAFEFEGDVMRDVQVHSEGAPA